MTVGTEKTWAVDSRHGGVGALWLEDWAPVQARRKAMIHGWQVSGLLFAAEMSCGEAVVDSKMG